MYWFSDFLSLEVVFSIFKKFDNITLIEDVSDAHYCTRQCKCMDSELQ